MKNTILLPLFVAFIAAAFFGVVFSAQAQYYSNCNYHAFKDCVGNAIYWFSSCSERQDLFQDCASFGQVCKYGQCANFTPVIPPQKPYVLHYATKCKDNNLYWYDSLGVAKGFYKSCQDNNSCTQDTCTSKKCSNTLKCDGTTCVVGSADYNTYCAPSHCGNGTCEPTLEETFANCPNDCKQVNLSVSFFVKNDANSNQWQKNVQITPNGNIYFMASVNNNSGSQVDDVIMSVNIPIEISYLGNVKVNDIAVSGDIVAGISIGSLAAGTAKSITFEGRTQSFAAQGQKQATATAKVGEVAQSDFTSIDLNPTIQPSAEPKNPVSSGFVNFLKRWYLWILVGLVLIFLFAVVFRRLSSNA